MAKADGKHGCLCAFGPNFRRLNRSLILLSTRPVGSGFVNGNYSSYVYSETVKFGAKATSSQWRHDTCPFALLEEFTEAKEIIYFLSTSSGHVLCFDILTDHELKCLSTKQLEAKVFIKAPICFDQRVQPSDNDGI